VPEPPSVVPVEPVPDEDDEDDEPEDDEPEDDELDDDVPVPPVDEPAGEPAVDVPDPVAVVEPWGGAPDDDLAEPDPLVPGAADPTGAPSTPMTTGEEPSASPAPAPGDEEASRATVDLVSLRPDTTGMVSIRAVTARITAAPSSSRPACWRTVPRNQRRSRRIEPARRAVSGGLTGRWRTGDTSRGS
jgi:hypothetical protein